MSGSRGLTVAFTVSAPMAHWLLKTEPSTYSWADLLREGRTTWDGVRNPSALRHLRAMRTGDQAFVYHTGSEKRIVGIAKVVADAYPDPASGAGDLVVVDLVPDRALAAPVTLAAVKADPRFRDFALARLPRLSVMPVTDAQWKALLTLGGDH